MKIITFTNDVPKGFKSVQLTTLSDIEDILQQVTRTYMENNYPELVLGENDYEMKRANYRTGLGYYSVDQYNCYGEYDFTIRDIDFIQG